MIPFLKHVINITQKVISYTCPSHNWLPQTKQLNKQHFIFPNHITLLPGSSNSYIHFGRRNPKPHAWLP